MSKEKGPPLTIYNIIPAPGKLICPQFERYDSKVEEPGFTPGQDEWQKDKGNIKCYWAVLSPLQKKFFD